MTDKIPPATEVISPERLRALRIHCQILRRQNKEQEPYFDAIDVGSLIARIKAQQAEIDELRDERDEYRTKYMDLIRPAKGSRL